jgi:hypothetical protein
MFGKNKLSNGYKRGAQVWSNGYARGYHKGSREMNQFVRDMIIKNLLADAVITTNADVKILERVIEIVEES